MQPLCRDTSNMSWEQKMAELLSLVNEPIPAKYDWMWQLFAEVGQPVTVHKQLFTLLVSSKKREDRQRAIWVAEQLRSTGGDAWTPQLQEQLINLHLKMQDTEDVVKLCKQSALDYPEVEHWAKPFLGLLFRGRYEEAVSIWMTRSIKNESSAMDAVKAGLSSNAHLTEHTLPFLRQLVDSDARMNKDALQESNQIAIMLLKLISQNETHLCKITTTQLLSLFSLTASLGVLLPGTMVTLMRTLVKFKSRPKLLQAVAVLRSFCYRFPDAAPPLALLRQLFKASQDFRAISTMEYIAERIRILHGRADPAIFRERLMAYARLGDYRRVEEVYSEYIETYGNENPDGKVPQSFIAPKIVAYGKASNVRKAGEVFDLVLSQYEKPTRQIYNALLAAYCRANDVQGVVRHFTAILDAGRQDSLTFAIVMKFFGNRGDVVALQELLSIARARSVELTPKMLQTVVNGLCNNQKLTEAEAVALKWSNVGKKDKSPLMWNTLLGAYSVRGDLKSVMRIQHKMKTRNIEWDHMTLARLMQALASVKRTEAAREVLREVVKNDQLEVLPYHYTILINGYNREGNAHMSLTVYHEMMDRFSRLRFSARVRRLQILANRQLRDAEEAYKLSNRLDFDMKYVKKLLLALLDEVDMRLRGQSHTRGNWRVLDPHFYYELLISTQGVKESENHVQELVLAYLRGRDKISDDEDEQIENIDNPSPIPFLTTLMNAQTRIDAHDAVISTFEKAVAAAMRVSLQEDLSHLTEPAADVRTILDSSLPKTFFDSFPSKHSNGPQVIPHRRFLLSRPFNIYLRTLAKSRGMHAVNVAVSDYVAQGFVLNTFNLRVYIELLALSPDSRDILRAFALFEEKFIPNLPNWKVVRRGRKFHPTRKVDTASKTFGPERQLISKKESDIIAKFADPEYMQPTYVCLTHLGAAMLQLRDRSIRDGGQELAELIANAPKTYKTILRTPYVKDAVQGMLLRDREPFANSKPRTGPPFSDPTPGVLARPSKSESAKRIAAWEDHEASSWLAFAMWQEAVNNQTLTGDFLLDVEDELKDLDNDGLRVSQDQDHEVPIRSESWLGGSNSFTRAVLSPPHTQMWRSYTPKYHLRHLTHNDVVLFQPDEAELEPDADTQQKDITDPRPTPADELASMDIAEMNNDEANKVNDTKEDLGIDTTKRLDHTNPAFLVHDVSVDAKSTMDEPKAFRPLSFIEPHPDSKRPLQWLEPRDIFDFREEYARPADEFWVMQDELLESEHLSELEASMRAEEAERKLGTVTEITDEKE